MSSASKPTSVVPNLEHEEDHKESAWPPLDLTIEELDEPVFQPQQVVPNATTLDEPRAKK